MSGLLAPTHGLNLLPPYFLKKSILTNRLKMRFFKMEKCNFLKILQCPDFENLWGDFWHLFQPKELDESDGGFFFLRIIFSSHVPANPKYEINVECIKSARFCVNKHLLQLVSHEVSSVETPREIVLLKLVFNKKKFFTASIYIFR